MNDKNPVDWKRIARELKWNLLNYPRHAADFERIQRSFRAVDAYENGLKREKKVSRA